MPGGSPQLHAQARYRAGDMALAQLLAEEHVLRDAEDADARVHTVTAIDLVPLFKALGGRWDAPSARRRLLTCQAARDTTVEGKHHVDAD